MPQRCDKLADFLSIELKIIEEHIDRHKWFNHIENKDEAVADFVKKYGWLMRCVYCNYVCSNSGECKIPRE